MREIGEAAIPLLSRLKPFLQLLVRASRRHVPWLVIATVVMALSFR